MFSDKEVKPCPICGNPEPEIMYHGDYWAVSCPDTCVAMQPSSHKVYSCYGDTREEAIKQWNQQGEQHECH